MKAPIENNQIVISKTDSELDIILSKITKENKHHEVLDDDNIVGKESW